MCRCCSTSTLPNFNPVDLVFAQILHILFYTTLCSCFDVASYLVCIIQNLEELGNQECYHKINAFLHHFESSFKQDNKKFRVMGT